jgi:RNA polymerase sigma-70 factor (ECF subfamily)
LVAACVATRDESVWAEFIRRFHPLITTVVLRKARQWGEPLPSLIDDLTQETYLKLCADDCRLLKNFRSQYPCAIYSFLKVVTANVVHDHFKASCAAKRGAGSFRTDHQGYDGNENILADGTFSRHESSMVEQSILLDEIDRCLVQSVAPSELVRCRRIFWLYYRCGLSARDIAALPNIELTTKGVESAVLRLSRLVRKALARTPNLNDIDVMPAEGSLEVQLGEENAGWAPE